MLFKLKVEISYFYVFLHSSFSPWDREAVIIYSMTQSLLKTIHINSGHTNTPPLHFIYTQIHVQIYCTTLHKLYILWTVYFCVRMCTVLDNFSLPHTFVVHTLCLDQLDCFTFILQSSHCTPLLQKSNLVPDWPKLKTLILTNESQAI